jgi:hypothetical protein
MIEIGVQNSISGSESAYKILNIKKKSVQEDLHSISAKDSLKELGSLLASE